MNTFFYCVFAAWAIFTLVLLVGGLYALWQARKMRDETERIARRDLTLRMVEKGSVK